MAYDYALEIFFDLAADAAIRKAWADIATEAGVPNRMAALAGSRPHVSLGVFGEPDLDAVIKGLEAATAGQEAFEIRLDSLGMFTGTAGVLFFGPSPNRQLLGLHRKCYESLVGLVQGWEDYYLPEKLAFHCTLNIGLSQPELLRAAAAALKTPLPISAQAMGLGLVKIQEGEFMRHFNFGKP